MISCLCLIYSTSLVGADDKSFTFIAMGDTNYSGLTFTNYKRMIEGINKSDSRFVVHVGDIKGAGIDCSDKHDKIAVKLFTDIHKPIVYTPGDHDWTDCENSLRRLATVRKRFFLEPSFSSLKSVEKQSEKSKQFSKYVENLTWSLNGIRFVTLHIVGFNNNCILPGYRWDFKNSVYDKFLKYFVYRFLRNFVSESFFERYFSASNLPYGNEAECREREKANLEWLDYSFGEAVKNRDKGMVIFNHADPFLNRNNPFAGRPIRLRTGYNRIIEKIRYYARVFGKEILWVQGDSHFFKIDKPFFSPPNIRFPLNQEVNLTRVIVPGSPYEYFITIRVSPNSKPVFVVNTNFKGGSNGHD